MQMMKMVALGVAMVAGAAHAQTPSVQERFSQGEVLRTAGDREAALALFESIERELAARPGSPNLFLARTQKALLLVELGRADQARATLDAALAAPGAQRAEVAAARYDALLLRGNLNGAALLPAAALADYRAAASAAPTPTERASALLGAAKIAMFDDPTRALAEIDQAIAIAEPLETVPRQIKAALVGLRGRVLLNRGDLQGARDHLARAIRMSGGLDTRPTNQELAIRGDMAIALLLLGQDEEAKRYFAYSGAGMGKVSLPIPSGMALPDCGEEGLTPRDSAVVQLTLAEDGSVLAAEPVSATRGGGIVWPFVRSVASWRFDADVARRLPSYIRNNSRVQVACRRSMTRLNARMALDGAFTAWFSSEPPPPDGLDKAALRARFADASLPLPARARAVFAAQQGFSSDDPTAATDFDELIRLTRESGASAHVVTQIRLLRIWNAPFSDGSRGLERRIEALTALAADPITQSDPATRSTVRIELARMLSETGRRDQALIILRQVTGDTALEPLDPLRVAALVEIADLEAAAGRLEQAQAAYAETGLTAQQCALYGDTPRLLRNGMSFASFPEEALRWGFEGWTSIEYDVTGDGRASNIRATASYPPQVFSQAATNGFGNARFETSFRPGGDPGCSAAQARIRFSQPN